MRPSLLPVMRRVCGIKTAPELKSESAPLRELNDFGVQKSATFKVAMSIRPTLSDRSEPSVLVEPLPAAKKTLLPSDERPTPLCQMPPFPPLGETLYAIFCRSEESYARIHPW